MKKKQKHSYKKKLPKVVTFEALAKDKPEYIWRIYSDLTDIQECGYKLEALGWHNYTEPYDMIREYLEGVDEDSALEFLRLSDKCTYQVVQFSVADYMKEFNVSVEE